MEKDIPEVERPEVPIRTPQKVTVGIATLIFGLLLAFVFAEERQRGIAMAIAIPFSLCLVYFAYLWLSDNAALRAYKRYLAYLRKLAAAAAKDQKDTKQKIGMTRFDATTSKDFVGVIAVLDLVITIALMVEKIQLYRITGLMFVILMIAFAVLENQEAKKVEDEIDNLEKAASSMTGKTERTEARTEERIET